MGQKADDGRQRTEDGRQMEDDGRRNLWNAGFKSAVKTEDSANKMRR